MFAKELRVGGQRMDKNRLTNLIDKLDKDDSHIIRQIIAIIYRHLEKRGRV